MAGHAPNTGSDETPASEQARARQIILNTPLRRAPFAGGLIGIVVPSVALCAID